MKQIIHKLRQQPEEHRRSMMHLLIGISAFILFVLWSWSFGGNVSSPETAESVKEGLEPFSVLKANILEGYKDISQ